jgi:hypothetical protein
VAAHRGFAVVVLVATGSAVGALLREVLSLE